MRLSDLKPWLDAHPEVKKYAPWVLGVIVIFALGVWVGK